MAERWKPIQETHGVYEVSSLGRLRRAKPSFRKGFAPVGAILKPGYDYGGYAIHVLCFDLKKVTRTAHRLVLDAFVCKRPPGMQANHKDGHKSNNSLINLEWVTPSYNQIHARKILGKWRRRHKLTLSQVKTIKQISMKGGPLKTLADRFHVSKTTICKIKHSSFWSDFKI